MRPSARWAKLALAAVVSIAVVLLVLLASNFFPRGNANEDRNCAYVDVAGSTPVDLGGDTLDASAIDRAAGKIRVGGLWEVSHYSPYSADLDPTILGGFGMARIVAWNGGVVANGRMTFHQSTEGGDWVRIQFETTVRHQGAGRSTEFQGMLEHILRVQVGEMATYLEQWNWSPGATSIFLEQAGACQIPVVA